MSGWLRNIKKNISKVCSLWIAKRMPAAQSVVLKQASIFIFPSSQGFIFILTVLAIFIGGVNYSNSLILALTFFLFSLFLICIIHTYKNFSGIKIEFTEAQPGFVGEDVVYEFSLKTSDHLIRERIQLSFDKTTFEITDILKDETAIVKIFMPAQKRGLQKPGRLLIQSCFPLGILKVWSWVDLRASSIIYPKVVKGPKPVSSLALEANTDQADHVAGSDDFSGLRRFQEGDSLSRVYWKILSRGLPLATKEFEKPNEKKIWLNLDAAKGTLEERISILTYWVLKCSEDNTRFGLVMDGKKISMDRGIHHKRRCLEALALYQSSAQSND